jgi:hypothetical protein
LSDCAGDLRLHAKDCQMRRFGIPTIVVVILVVLVLIYLF